MPKLVTLTDPACPSCGAGLAPDQDWCLECGAAASERARPHTRRRVATLALITGVLTLVVIGATAYALTKKGDVPTTVKVAAKPPPTAGDPGPAAPAPAAAPAVAPPAATTTPPPATTTPTPAVPKIPSAPSATPVTSSPITSGSTGSPSTSPSTTTPVVPTYAPRKSGALEPVALDPLAANGYDPNDSAGEHNSEAHYVLDGDPSTQWTTEDYSPAGDLGGPGVGVYVRAPKALAARELHLQTTTPGFDVKVLGAADGPPKHIESSAWQELARHTSVRSDQTLKLDRETERYRYYLVLITALPGHETSAAISDIQLFR